MAYRIAGIDVHKKKLAVVVADVEVEDEYQFERRWYGSQPEQFRALAEWLIEQQVEEVVMESTDAGCAHTLFSLASAAAVTCGIMKPEFNPAAGARNGGKPSFSAGLTNRSVRRSDMPASAVSAIARKSKAKASGSP